MQKCSARAAVTPSGSRSDERRMHAQRDGHAFRSGQRNHFAILCLAPDFSAPRRAGGVRAWFATGRAAVGVALWFPPLSTPFYVSGPPRGWRRGGVISPAASVKRKNPAEGGNRAAGCCEPEAEARVSFHQAN